MNSPPSRHICPVCKWDFKIRKKKCCPGCGVLLILPSDHRSDHDNAQNYWHWESLKRKWVFFSNWEDEMKKASKLMEVYRASLEADSEKRRMESKLIH